jgi:hypothetical protein
MVLDFAKIERQASRNLEDLPETEFYEDICRD